MATRRTTVSPTRTGCSGRSRHGMTEVSLTLCRAYFHSTATLNYIRTLLTSGFADLHKPLDWSFSNVRSPELQEAFAGVIDSLQDSIDFMKVATGKSGGQARGGLETVDIYTRCVTGCFSLNYFSELTHLQSRGTAARVRGGSHTSVHRHASSFAPVRNPFPDPTDVQVCLVDSWRDFLPPLAGPPITTHVDRYRQARAVGRQALQCLVALYLDRRQDEAAGRCARRVLPGHRQPDVRYLEAKNRI